MQNNYFDNGVTNNNDSSKGDFIMSTGTIKGLEVFAEVVKGAMEHHFGEAYKVQTNDIVKNNGVKSMGLTIQEIGRNIAPTVYLDEIFEMYQKGVTLEEIFGRIIEISEESRGMNDFDVESITDYERAKKRICYRLVNAERNQGLLKDVPHKVLLDLALIPFLLVSKGDEGVQSATITNHIMETWNVDIDELFELAVENTQRLFRGTVTPMHRMLGELYKERMDAEDFCELFDMLDEVDELVPMYVCTNEVRIHGAGAIFYDGLLEEFANEVGTDFYILPSSIHETLLVPVKDDMKGEDFKEMVQCVNATEVAPQEILSNNVYYYNRLTGRVELV